VNSMRILGIAHFALPPLDANKTEIKLLIDDSQSQQSLPGGLWGK